jgi:signal transduction histidine kinase
MVPDELAASILGSVGAKTIVLKMKDTRRLLAASDMPPRIDATFDLRDPTAWDSIVAAFYTLTASPGRILSVTGPAPMGAEFIEITLDETPLRAAMRSYSENILLLSLFISAIVAGLAVLAIHLMVLRPVRRLTSSITQFGDDPENAARIIEPSGRTHEIGIAEDALAVMQHTLVEELNQKKHLAALGLAVAKINHDLRNMLASAQLMSDRLSENSDPLSRRLAPKLVATLDRAIAFCQSTLVYGRAAERPPKLQRVGLRGIVTDAAETVSPPGLARVEIIIETPDDFEVRADPEHLFRILLNLLRNAVDALESAGPEPGRRPRVRVRAWYENAGAIIEVADTGPGIPLMAREHLFAAFQTSGRVGGTGLGLSIAADLVRAQGGEISLVEPSEDGGATFHIFMPTPRRRQKAVLLRSGKPTTRAP